MFRDAMSKKKREIPEELLAGLLGNYKKPKVDYPRY